MSQPSTEQQNQRALKGADTTEDEVLDVIGSGGMPLDFSIQRELGERMDADFSDVRIHTGGKAAQAAESIDAKAFTCGNAIVFNSGEYDPRSADGQHLLAHELAHVKQQHGGAPLSMKPKSNADLEIDPDPQLEREADEAATEALAGEPLTINRMGTDVHVQRSAKGEAEYVTKDDVLEIVDNYYRGHVEDRAESDPTAAGPERDTARGSLEQSGNSAENSGFLGKMRSVGSDLSQAMTKGAIGSLAGAGGKIVGKVGGGSLGAILGGAVGSFAGPVGTAAGAAAGYQIGGTLGGEILGGAASDMAKQVTDYTLPKEHAASVADLQQKYQQLEEEVKELKKAGDTSTGGGPSRGLSQSTTGGN
ncbi:DUF4157 domain-containing protein [Natrinema pallidum]|uniref:DUF4157 domain-containing protein n=1 Tax=Natrinema pallidum TaxID=69527 RepID=A0A4P9TIY8_9EURY|nr:DUF4157 domain-containing protein [Natrinema pallidum]